MGEQVVPRSGMLSFLLLFLLAVVLNVHISPPPPPNQYAEALLPKVVVLRGGAFER